MTWGYLHFRKPPIITIPDSYNIYFLRLPKGHLASPVCQMRSKDGDAKALVTRDTVSQLLGGDQDSAPS